MIEVNGVGGDGKTLYFNEEAILALVDHGSGGTVLLLKGGESFQCRQKINAVYEQFSQEWQKRFQLLKAIGKNWKALVRWEHVQSIEINPGFYTQLWMIGHYHGVTIEEITQDEGTR